jgi:hypothetical protein
MSLQTALSRTRQDLADLIGTVTATDADGSSQLNVPIELVAPNPITPPCIIAGPDDPYLDFGDPDANFGEMRVNLLVILAAPAGANEVSAAQVDEMLTTVLPRLLAADPTFIVDRVDQPGKVSLEGQVFLGAVIRLHTFSTLA